MTVVRRPSAHRQRSAVRSDGQHASVAGMRCPSCAALDDKVVDSRGAEDGTAIRRRRECLACGHRFTTFERLEEVPLVVVKRSGDRVPFERDKIEAGVRAAAKGRPVPTTRWRRWPPRSRTSCASRGGEVQSEQIGVAVLERLREIDKVAYLRFASVYKDFDDPCRLPSARCGCSPRRPRRNGTDVSGRRHRPSGCEVVSRGGARGGGRGSRPASSTRARSSVAAVGSAPCTIRWLLAAGQRRGHGRGTARRRRSASDQRAVERRAALGARRRRRP